MKDENVEKYWDEFVLHNPISRSRLERYQEFAIFLQNNANKFDVNDKTLERIVNWAQEEAKNEEIVIPNMKNTYPEQRFSNDGHIKESFNSIVIENREETKKKPDL